MALKTRLTSLAILLSGMGMASLALAGLGPIRVLSVAGQPFRAEIPIVDENLGEPVTVGLADRQNTTLLTPYSPSAAVLHFQVVPSANGNQVLVTGPEDIPESALRFAVELKGPQGRVVREFGVNYQETLPAKPVETPLQDVEKKSMAFPAATLRTDGLGLGEIKVLSHLGEPLRIELMLLGKALEEGLPPQVALYAPALGSEGYSAGLDRLISSMDSQTEHVGYGQYKLRLKTEEPVNEPVLQFLLEVSAGKQKAKKEYVVFLGPAQAKDTSLAEVLSPQAAIKMQAGLKTYRVKPNETLLGIASKLNPSGRLAEVAQQLFQANPEAFIDNNIQKIRAGERLSYPADWKQVARSPSRTSLAADKGRTEQSSIRISSSPKVKPVDTVPLSAQTRQRVEQLKAQLRKQDLLFGEMEKRAQAIQTAVAHYQDNKGVATEIKNASLASPASAVKPRAAPVLTDPVQLKSEKIKPLASTLHAIAPNVTEAKAENVTAPLVTPSVSVTAHEETSKPTKAPVVSPAIPKADPASSTAPVSGTILPIKPEHISEEDWANMHPAEQLGHSDYEAFSQSLAKPNDTGLAAERPSNIVLQVEPVSLETSSNHPQSADVLEDLSTLLTYNSVLIGAGSVAAAGALSALLLARQRRRKRERNQSILMGQMVVSDSSPVESMQEPPTAYTPISATPPGKDYMAEVDQYVASGHYTQALNALQLGLQYDPMREDLRSKLLAIIFSQRDQSAFLYHASVVKDLFGEESQLWVYACDLGQKLLPGHPLFAIKRSRYQDNTCFTDERGVMLEPLLFK